MRIGLVCGGPSKERGISLNSARSAMDHLTSLGWEVVPFYCDPQRNFYRLSPSQLYSNTPSDFDYKLANTALPLTQSEFINACRETDIIFPIIHGVFGEDGELQELLEENTIPFIGSSSKSCRLVFDKAEASRNLTKYGFATLPNCIIDENDTPEIRRKKVVKFFCHVNGEKIVVKPSGGGSSIGIRIVKTPEEALEQVDEIYNQKHGGQALIEPYCQGREFTVIVIQNKKDEPVALIPTEIELKDHENIFTYNYKYLPSDNVKYHCPPHFNNETIGQIQKTAEILFSLFGLRDFLRIDGWILDDDRLIYSDFNTISAMEQNSFLFIQGSRIGFTHSDMLRTIVTHAAQRYSIDCTVYPMKKNQNAQKIWVLFGGETAERQVSLTSGTNVWLKLRQVADYLASPYILGPNHEVWELPYSFTLNHTTEEILVHCAEADDIISRLKVLVPPILQRLNLSSFAEDSLIQPHRMSLDQFCQEAAKENAFVFNALHGGEGEDGRIQAKFNKYGLAYNGSDKKASHLCMDKYKTGTVLRALNDSQLTSAPKMLIPAKQSDNVEFLWKMATLELKTQDIIIKPQGDGCSTGVARLISAQELKIFLDAMELGQPMIKMKQLTHSDSDVELPINVDNFVLEPYILTDRIRINDLNLDYGYQTGWIELTVGVLEEKGKYHAMSPSITVVEGNVLSLEEKFQGGTGINLTPPPTSIIKSDQINLIKTEIEKAAKALGIQGYARIDIFFHIGREEIMVIEANTLPALTPSTVIYHQALAEVPALFPQSFLSKLVKFGIERRMLAKADPWYTTLKY